MDPDAKASSTAGEAPSAAGDGDPSTQATPSTDAAPSITQAAEQTPPPPPPPPPPAADHHQPLSRYESQKRRDWNTFLQYLKNHKPPLTIARCSGAHVIEFMKYLDQFGKTKVHSTGCPHFGHTNPPSPCACPLRQAWGSLDALIGRLRAAYEESGGKPEANPFAARAVRIYLREVRESQAKARGIPYEKKKRKRNNRPQQPPSAGDEGSNRAEEEEGASSTSAGASTATTTSVTANTTTTAEGSGEGSGAPPPPPEGSTSSPS